MEGLARLVERVLSFARPDPEDAEAYIARAVNKLEELVAQAKRCAALALAAEKMAQREGMRENERTLSDAIKQILRDLEERLAEARGWKRVLPSRRQALREGRNLCERMEMSGAGDGLAQIGEDLKELAGELHARFGADPPASERGS
jgi:hypothetical protein